MKKIISFASDFGTSDGSVGVVKGVINRVDSDLKIIDILGREVDSENNTQLFYIYDDGSVEKKYLIK